MHIQSAIKMNTIFAICSNMDGLGGHYAQLNNPERERQILYDITNMWNQKNTTNTNKIQKKKQTLQTQRTNTSGYQWRK